MMEVDTTDTRQGKYEKNQIKDRILWFQILYIF
jgi:hypothetical protein